VLYRSWRTLYLTRAARVPVFQRLAIVFRAASSEADAAAMGRDNGGGGGWLRMALALQPLRRKVIKVGGLKGGRDALLSFNLLARTLHADWLQPNAFSAHPGKKGVALGQGAERARQPGGDGEGACMMGAGAVGTSGSKNPICVRVFSSYAAPAR
jgi:hypothetical protein